MDFLISIPGPAFLLYFSIYSVCLIFILARYLRRDGTEGMEPPEPTRMSAIDLALLKNGVKGAITILVFNLWQKKAIEISRTAYGVSIGQMPADTSGFSKLEKAVYELAGLKKYYSSLFKKPVLESMKILLEQNIHQCFHFLVAKQHQNTLIQCAL